MSHHSPPHLCRTTLETLHYNIYNNINVVAAALSDIAVTVREGCQVTPGSICFICYLETAPANTDTDWTAQSTAVLIKLGMFILITDISLIAPQHQKVIRRQQLSSVSLRSLFRRRQMLLISFSVLLNPRSF